MEQQFQSREAGSSQETTKQMNKNADQEDLQLDCFERSRLYEVNHGTVLFLVS